MDKNRPLEMALCLLDTPTLLSMLEAAEASHNVFHSDTTLEVINTGHAELRAPYRFVPGTGLLPEGAPLAAR